MVPQQFILFDSADDHISITTPKNDKNPIAGSFFLAFLKFGLKLALCEKTEELHLAGRSAAVSCSRSQ
jgi:hypothetical protein